MRWWEENFTIDSSLTKQEVDNFRQMLESKKGRDITELEFKFLIVVLETLKQVMQEQKQEE